MSPGTCLRQTPSYRYKRRFPSIVVPLDRLIRLTCLWKVISPRKCLEG